MALQKPPFFATILTIIAIAILCTLGTWQVKRLEWKETLLAKIEEQRQEDGLITANKLEVLSYNDDPYLYKLGRIKGRFTGKTRYIMPRTRDGISGKDVLAPVITGNNRFLLVNLGWLPFDHEDEITLPLRDRITLHGVLRRPDGKTAMTPENEDEKGIWYAVNFDNLGHGFVPQSYDALPAVFYNEGQLAFTSTAIIPHESGWEPRNNHRSYAIFWYTLAFVLAVIFFIRFMREPKP